MADKTESPKNPNPRSKGPTESKERKGPRQISEAEIQEVVDTVTRSLRRSPFLRGPIMDVASGTGGARSIRTTTGECQGLALAVQDMDKVMVFVSRQTLFGRPEVLQARVRADQLIQESAQKLAEAVTILVKSSGFDTKNLRYAGLRESVTHIEAVSPKSAV
ncbi:hypothetical protein JKG47_12920 [Acidithiobacillus sp. MC6.1]|nr:hypothetical protein [Acidithiobacillus sp. MC6.1]